MLDPVLDRRVIRKGRGLTMQLADKEARHTPPRSPWPLSACHVHPTLHPHVRPVEQTRGTTSPRHMQAPSALNLTHVWLIQTHSCCAGGRWTTRRRSACSAPRGCPTRTSRPS